MVQKRKANMLAVQNLFCSRIHFLHFDFISFEPFIMSLSLDLIAINCKFGSPSNYRIDYCLNALKKIIKMK